MPSPSVNSSTPSAPSLVQLLNTVPALQEQKSGPEMVIDELDLHFSPEDSATIDKVEEKVTYWTWTAEALRQLSLVPRVLERRAMGTVKVLEWLKAPRLVTYFEMCERGSKWLYLDAAHLKALEASAKTLSRFETACLRTARGIGKLIPWTTPAMVAWDCFKAFREHDPAKRTTAVGNAAITIGWAITSFAFPGFSMLVVAVQCIDALKGGRLATAVGKVLQRDWDLTRARQA